MFRKYFIIQYQFRWILLLHCLLEAGLFSDRSLFCIIYYIKEGRQSRKRQAHSRLIRIRSESSLPALESQALAGGKERFRAAQSLRYFRFGPLVSYLTKGPQYLSRVSVLVRSHEVIEEACA